MDLFLIYLWLKLSTVQNFLIVAIIISAASVAVLVLTTFVMAAEGDGQVAAAATVYLKKALWALGTTTTLVLVLPTTTQVAILVGANYTNKMLDTPEAEKVSALIRAKVNELLDEELTKVSKQDKK